MPEDELWNRIDAFELDDPDSDFSFSDRLARENGWKHAYTLRCIEEYKRFMYLVCKSGHPVTPSDQVDQVWHLHLLYTQSYWVEFCEKTIGRKIHHEPTKGGQKEKDRYHNYYEETRASYKKFFQEDAPSDIWPDSTIRFGQIVFQRVNLHKYQILPRLSYWMKKWKS